MKERFIGPYKAKWFPLICDGESVRGIIKGNKIQTRRIPSCANSLVDGRRVSKATWDSYDFDFSRAMVDPGPSPVGNPGPYFKVPSRAHGTTHRLYCFWWIGDYFWVKEVFQVWSDGSYEYPDECDPVEGSLSGEARPGVPWEDMIGSGYGIEYKATSKSIGPWRSPLFMPRWASRHTLKITDVRGEQLQEISEVDSTAEGISFYGGYHRSVTHEIKGTLKCWPTARMAFEKRWNSLNAKRGYPWSLNHPVWVTEFELQKGG